ncbi:hypothetical protein GEMRC1_001185 [Eukaryota sp. GEM-RC1]
MNPSYPPYPAYNQSVSAVHPVMNTVPPPQYAESPSKRNKICLALICWMLLMIVVAVLLFIWISSPEGGPNDEPKSEVHIEGYVISESGLPLIADVNIVWRVCFERNDETSSKTISTRDNGAFSATLTLTKSHSCYDSFYESTVYFELSSPDHLFSPRTISLSMMDYVRDTSGDTTTFVVEYNSYLVSGQTLFNGNSVENDFDYELDRTNDDKSHGSTDSEGRFSFTFRGLNQDYIALHFENSELCLQGSKTVAIVDAENLIIAMESTAPPTLVSGTIIYEGSPVVATVVIRPSGALEPTTLTTGSDGKFSTEVLACGSKIQFEVSSSSDEFDPTTIEKYLDDVTDIEIAVYKFFQVTGDITVNGALSNLLDVRLIDKNGNSYTRTPSSSGAYTFSDVIAGSVQIGSNPYWTLSRQTFTLTADRTVSLSVSFTMYINVHATSSGNDVTDGQARLTCTQLGSNYVNDLDANGKTHWNASPSTLIDGCLLRVIAPRHVEWVSPSFSLIQTISIDAKLQKVDALSFKYDNNEVVLGVRTPDWRDSSTLQTWHPGMAPSCRGGRLWTNCQSAPFTSDNCPSHFNTLSSFMYPDSAATITQASVTINSVACTEYRLSDAGDYNRRFWYVSHSGSHTVRVRDSEWIGYWTGYQDVEIWNFSDHEYLDSYSFGC